MTSNYCNQSDAALLRASNEQPQAFGELYERHVEVIYSWFARRIPWAAADLTAETFAAAWLVRRRFRDKRGGTALPWLYGIAMNVLSETVRREQVEARARTRLGLPTELATDEGFEAVERQLSPRESLREALLELPTHEREATELRVVEEMAYEEIARKLSIRPAAARLRVSRALKAGNCNRAGGAMTDPLTHLSDFRAQLESAIAGQISAETRHRTRTRRGVALALVTSVAALALGASLTLSSGALNPFGASSASAGTVVRNSLRALEGADPNAVFHIAITGHQFDAAHPDQNLTWTDESWEFGSGSDARHRQLEKLGSSAATESGSEGGKEEIYDRLNNTIYSSDDTTTPQEPASVPYALGAKGNDGRSIVHVQAPKQNVFGSQVSIERTTLQLSDEQRRKLQSGDYKIGWLLRKSAGGRVSVFPGLQKQSSRKAAGSEQTQPTPFTSSFTTEILKSLRAGQARLAGHKEIDGIDTLKLEMPDSETYFVNSTSYAPVEIDTRGASGGSSIRFDAYEFLPRSAATEGLASVSEAHPRAALVADSSKYAEAQSKFFPHG